MPVDSYAPVLSFKFSVTVVQFLPCQASRLPSHRSPFHHCPAIALSSSAPSPTSRCPSSSPSSSPSPCSSSCSSSCPSSCSSRSRPPDQAGLGVQFASAEAQIPTPPECMVLSSTPHRRPLEGRLMRLTCRDGSRRRICPRPSATDQAFFARVLPTRDCRVCPRLSPSEREAVVFCTTLSACRESARRSDSDKRSLPGSQTFRPNRPHHQPTASLAHRITSKELP